MLNYDEAAAEAARVLAGAPKRTEQQAMQALCDMKLGHFVPEGGLMKLLRPYARGYEHWFIIAATPPALAAMLNILEGIVVDKSDGKSVAPAIVAKAMPPLPGFSLFMVRKIYLLPHELAQHLHCSEELLQHNDVVALFPKDGDSILVLMAVGHAIKQLRDEVDNKGST